MFLPWQLRRRGWGFDTQVYYASAPRWSIHTSIPELPNPICTRFARTSSSAFHCLFPDHLRTPHKLRPRRPAKCSTLSRLVALLLFLPSRILDHTVPAGAALGNVPFLRFSCTMSVSVAVSFTLTLTMSLALALTLALALSRSFRLTSGWHALVTAALTSLRVGVA